MSMDFSGSAGAGSDFDVIPKGQLAWAILSIRGVKQSQNGGQYIDCELTIAEGQPYAGRKVWEMIGDPMFAGNSDKYKQMGHAAICRILESGRGAGPNKPEAYKINGYPELSGLKVAIKIGVEPGDAGHDDKNRVAEWLTPNPDSGSAFKAFERLMKGEYSPATKGGQQQAQSGFGGFGGGAPAATATPANSGFGNAGAGNSAPPANGFGFGGQAGNGAGQPQPSNAATVGATQENAGATSPSNPEQTPGWLAQAGGQAQQ